MPSPRGPALAERWRLAVSIALLLSSCAAVAVADSGNLDDFARCLTGKGVTMYGASWCPHCRAQLHVFGSAARYLKYVECSQPGTDVPTSECKRAGIGSFPTWEFRDRSRLKGDIALSRLGQKAGCHLPGGTAAGPSRGPPGDEAPPPAEPPLRLRRLDP